MPQPGLARGSGTGAAAAAGRTVVLPGDQVDRVVVSRPQDALQERKVLQQLSRVHQPLVLWPGVTIESGKKKNTTYFQFGNFPHIMNLESEKKKS